MVTTTFNSIGSVGYLGQQVNYGSTETQKTDSSEVEKNGEDKVTLSKKAQDLKQTYQKKETVAEQTYEAQSQKLERDYLQEKNKLEAEFLQKKSALGVNVYA